MTGARVGLAALATALLASGCSGSSSPPPPAPADPLVGLIREFRVSAGGELGGGSFHVWLLDEGGGTHRSRVTYGGSSEYSLRVWRAGGGWRISTQLISGVGPAPKTILVSGPESVSPDAPQTNGDFDFFRRLVRSGIAREVGGSTALGCTTYTAPLAVAVSGITDPEEAERSSGVLVGDGGETVVPIRLCGADRELGEVSVPAHRVRRDGSEGIGPSEAYAFTLLRSRPATAARIWRAFDLRAAYPGLPVARSPAEDSVP